MFVKVDYERKERYLNMDAVLTFEVIAPLKIEFQLQGNELDKRVGPMTKTFSSEAELDRFIDVWAPGADSE